MSTWEKLSAIDVGNHVEKKGNLTYLSWAWAWGALKNACPDATFEKHFFDGLPYLLDSQGFAYVKVSVTVEEQTITEVYPITDYKNAPIKNPNSFDVNTALQRCLTKAIAYHGLGHNIYAGEDLPTGEVVANTETPDPPAPEPVTENLEPPPDDKEDLLEMPAFLKRDDGKPTWAAQQIEGFKSHRHMGEHKLWWTTNEQTMDTMKQLDPEGRAAVVEAFNGRSQELTNIGGN
tara:strand:- start:1218 stop:1916 length:699 start_codon:yes stop_codon:yes gene_type:complete